MIIISASVNTVVIPALIGLGSLAVIFAGVLAVASRVFEVHEDPRIQELEELLPGANCGACGYPGCHGYAEAMINGEVGPDKCGPAGCGFIETASKVLGRDFGGVEPQVAFIHCKGPPVEILAFDYDGIETCLAASMVAGGCKGCAYGCIGFLDCVRQCMYGAIDVRDDGLPVINKEKCVSCRVCVAGCPRDLIEMVPADERDVHILCNNPERGKAVKEVCAYGCIGCTKCVKECPVEAISMDEGLAFIDYEKCTNCGKCVEVCPTDTIHNYNLQHWFTWEDESARARQAAVAS